MLVYQTYTDASILVYKFRPERTGFNMFAEYTQLKLTFLALHSCVAYARFSLNKWFCCSSFKIVSFQIFPTLFLPKKTFAGTQNTTVVRDNISKMKTTFDLNFDLYYALTQHVYTQTWKQREAVN